MDMKEAIALVKEELRSMPVNDILYGLWAGQARLSAALDEINNELVGIATTVAQLDMAVRAKNKKG